MGKFTRVALVVGDEADAGLSKTFDVVEPLERVLDAVVPLQQPSSALEARELQTFTKLEGGRVLAQGRMVAWVEEIADE